MSIYHLSAEEQAALRRALRASVRIVEEEKPRAQPNYPAMDDTAEWAQKHYAETHGRRLGDE